MTNAERQKLKRQNKAVLAGREYVPRGPKCKTPEESHKRKLQSKLRYRLKRAKKENREYIPNKVRRVDAHVDAWKSHQSLLKLNMKMQCDSHVKKYFQAIRNRAKSLKQYSKHREKILARHHAYKHNLVDGYVVSNLVALGVPIHEISSEVVEIKREQMLLRRLSLELKQSAKKLTKEAYESITNNS